MNNSITILGQIITFLLGLFSTYIIFNFMSRFDRNLYRKKYLYVTGYVFFTLVVFVMNILGIGILRLVITIIAVAIIGHLLYNNKRIYILYYCIYIVILIAFQIIISSIFQLICYSFNINFYSTDILLITTSIIIQFSNLSASRLFIIWYSCKKIEKITPVQYFNFLLLPIFSICYITTLMMYIQIYLSIEDIILLLVNIISIIALNIFITNIFESISKNNELKNQVLLYEQQAKMQYEYYSNLENKYQNSRKLIHDMKNHMQTIEDLYMLNENEKAKEYTVDMYKMFDRFVQKYYSSNKVLNVIINDKVQKAENHGVCLSCKIGEVNLDFIKDIDLTTIFSNLLDNAIEGATSAVKSKNILLIIDKFNESIIINITNSIDKPPLKDSSGFISNKKKHKGIGLQNVNLVLEKYEGNMRMECDKEVFKVNIVIPSN